MSKVSLGGSATGTATFDIVAPATNTNRTITLPDTSGQVSVLDLRAAQTASGTSVDFLNIPATARRITVMFDGVSTSSTNAPRVQLGTGSTPTYVSSGYAASGGVISNANSTAITAFTDGLPFSRSAVAADTMSSVMTILKITGTTWVASANTRTSGNTLFFTAAGQVDVGAVVTALRITINGTDTFDAGSISILVE